jgi:CheY-like chemotaxis protein
LTLINDLLDVSKLESGKVELERIPLPPREIADEICRLMSASATQKSVSLVCTSTPEVPEIILGDPSRLRQIIMNLIGNAIKFTERGSIELKLDRVTVEAGKEQLSIKVIDTGIGIPADKIESVFDSFTQVDSSTTRRYGGTGLGLAICRDLAEKMGGSITLESELGVGSEFTVLLPIDVPDGLPTVPAVGKQASDGEDPIDPVVSNTESVRPDSDDSFPNAEADGTIRILVAEDGAINQEVIVGLLEMNGYEVIVANDGEEAYRKAFESDYDLCLMDVDMPKMDGIEATKMIRQDVPGADHDSLPIIAMTAHSGDQIWSRCEAAGMNAYMPKPIDPEKLFANVNRFTKQLT